MKGLASPLEFAWPGGAGFGAATVVVAAVGPDVAATEDIVLVTEAVLGAGAEAAVVVGKWEMHSSQYSSHAHTKGKMVHLAQCTF